MLNEKEIKNDLALKCEYLRDEKIDIIIKMSFYRETLIYILNNKNYKEIAKIIKQLSMISSYLLFDCDSEHLIYLKLIKLLDDNNLTEEKLIQINKLLYDLDNIYLYRNSYFTDYSAYLKDSVDNPKYLFNKAFPVLERNEILNYIDNMMVR